jgi:hypothetical protein
MRLRPILLAAVLLTGCHDTTTPAAPSNAVVERFSGTVQPRQLDSHTFDTTGPGEVKVTLLALTPGDEVVVIWFGQIPGRLGVPQTCASASGQNNVVTKADIGKLVLLSDGVLAGHTCVNVVDPAFFDSTITPLHAAQTYTVEVSHAP